MTRRPASGPGNSRKLRRKSKLDILLDAMGPLFHVEGSRTFQGSVVLGRRRIGTGSSLLVVFISLTSQLSLRYIFLQTPSIRSFHFLKILTRENLFRKMFLQKRYLLTCLNFLFPNITDVEVISQVGYLIKCSVPRFIIN
jgi:hypothetical protein